MTFAIRDNEMNLVSKNLKPLKYGQHSDEKNPLQMEDHTSSEADIGFTSSTETCCINCLQ